MGKSTDTKAKKQITKPDSVKVNFKKVTKKEHAKYRIQVYSYYGSVFIMRKTPTCKGIKHLNTTPTNAIAHT